MPEEEISKERIIKTGRMLEKAKNIAVIIRVARKTAANLNTYHLDLRI